MKIENKVWVVTGGGSGMGQELTLQLLAKGAKGVAILDIHSMDKTVELAANSSKLTTHLVDVSNRKQVEQCISEILKAHGQVDGLINMAGIIQPFVKIRDLELEQIEKVMNVNFYGPLYLIRAFLPHLVERTEAHIVNVSSMGALFPVPGQVVYGASKAALKLLTEGLYSELADTNVHVTVVFPGAVKTNIVENSNIVIPKTAENGKSEALAADKAASMIVEGIEKNYFRVLVGSDAWIMDLYSRFRPRTAAKMIYEKMKNLLN